jgi:hypothetical protein
MALNWTQLESLVKDNYIPILSDQIFESSAFLKWLDSKSDSSKGGRNLVIGPIAYAKTSAAGTVKGFGPVDINPNDQVTAAEYDWATLYASLAVSFDEEDSVEGDPNAVMSLIETKMKLAKMTLSDLLGTAVFNDGSDADAPHGLRKIIGTDRTLGGINSTTYSWWDGNLYSDTTNYSKTNMVDPASAYYILKLLRNAWNGAKHNSEQPDIIVCTTGWENLMEEEIQPMTRYGNSDIAKANVDFASFAYKGKAPVVVDDLCPTAELYMLNSNWLKLYKHSKRNMVMGPFQKPVDRLARVAQITLKCQLATNGPRYQSRIQAATAIDS